MKNFRIPDPCPEKWSDMTPTEQGAVCSKCATEVIDFTNMTNDEIKAYMKQAAGKRVCAKMTDEQQGKAEFPPALIAQTGMSGFRNKLLYAMVMVFGMTFFGCEEHQDVGMVGEEHEVGDVEYVPDSTEKEPVKGKVEILEDTAKTKPVKVGKVEIDDSETDLEE